MIFHHLIHYKKMETTPRLCKCWTYKRQIKTDVIVSHPFDQPIKHEQLTDLFKKFGEIFRQPNLNDYEKFAPIKQTL